MFEFDPYKAPTTYMAQQLVAGVVQACLPSSGVAIVRSQGAYIDRMFVCKIPAVGGLFGAGSISVPQPGSAVMAWINSTTNTGTIIGSTATGKEPQSYKLMSFLHCYDWCFPVGDMKFTRAVACDIQEKANMGVLSSPCGATQDTYAGDYIIGDKNGPMAFFGRAQITVKGSGLAYTEYSALNNKITTVAQTYEFDSFSTRELRQTDVTRVLTASGAKQGLGVTDTQFDYPYEDQKGQGDTPNVKKSKTAKQPMYRLQRFYGGLVKGSALSVVHPGGTDEYNGSLPTVYTDTVDFFGGKRQASCIGISNIKTPSVYGFQQVTDSYVLKNLQSVQEQQPLTEVQPVDKALLLNAVVQKNGNKKELRQAFSKEQLQKMLKSNIDTQGSPASMALKDPWQDGTPQTAQQLAGPQVAEFPNSSRKTSSKVYNNCSFITQQPDGSILIKDGWGSQIRMTGGNIYISSALDTFIRPGRDLIGLAPRRMQMDANGAAVIASKKSLKLASQGDAVLSSGISGGSGFTVLQNRSGKGQDAGMVIRSNGNLSMTSSADIYIGPNDKTQKNAGNQATRGTGTVCIDGGNLILNADSLIKATASTLGLYSYSGSAGSGITLVSSGMSVTAPNITVDSASLAVGGIRGRQKVTIGSTEKTFKLSSSAGACNIRASGPVQCKDITIAGSANISGQLGAQSYFAWNTEPQETIPGVQKMSLKLFKRQIKNIFSKQVDALAVDYAAMVQEWYNDYYVCNHQLAFTDGDVLGFSGDYKMPLMCWQIQAPKDQILQPVIALKTGEKTQTMSYPGYTIWQSGTISSIDKQFKVTYTDNISKSYTVNTNKEDA